MAEDIFEIGWALCGDCCFDDKRPVFLGFFPSHKHALQVLEKMNHRATVGEFEVRACVWASDGFYVGGEGETQDQILDRVHALTAPDAEGNEVPEVVIDDDEAAIELLVKNANVMTEAFPEFFEESK